MYLVRPARSSDREKLVEFNLAMALETEQIKLDRKTLSSGVDAVFLDSARGFYLVCEENDKVIGSLMITSEWSDWRNGDIWWIQSVYVEPEHRRKGVFRALFMEITQRVLKEDSIAGVRLYVDEHNKNAINTYLSLGMATSNYEMLEFMK